MNEQQRLYNTEIIHKSCKGLCSQCQKVLWMDCKQRYRREIYKSDDGYSEVVQCEGFEKVLDLDQLLLINRGVVRVRTIEKELIETYFPKQDG